MRRCLVMLLCWFAGTVVAGPVMVQGVRLWTAPDNTRIVLDISGPVEHHLLTLSGPDRVVIDLSDTRLKPGVVAQGHQGVIKSLRTGIRNGRDLRVVFDLEAKVKPRSFYLKPDGTNGHRIVVDLRDGVPASASAASKQTAQAKPATKPAVIKRDPAPTVVSKPASAARDRQEPVQAKVTVPATPKVIAEQKEPAAAERAADQAVTPPPPAMPTEPVKSVQTQGRGRDLIVAIDAGHGGKDVGAEGPSGTREKDVVLAISRKLAALVDQEPGMRAVLVRDGDYFIRLRDRMKKARAQHADLFVSVHADAFNDRRARGSSVFVVSERGASSEMARILADQENAADLVGGVSLDDKDELLKSVLLDLSQSASIEASMNVADNVLGELKQVGSVHKSRVQQAGFMVLKSPDVPSILVETAFISNPTEEQQLRDPRHQQRLARAIMKGVRAYFRENPPPGTVMASHGDRTVVATRERATGSAPHKEHVIKRGETLSELAARYAVSMQQLRLANNLNDDRLLIGSVLRIPVTDS